MFPLSWFRLKFLRVLFISLLCALAYFKGPSTPLTRHRCWPVDFKWCASCAAVNASNLNCLAASSCVPQGRRGHGAMACYGYWCCCALVEPCGTKINQVGQVSSFGLCSLYLKLTCVRLNRTRGSKMDVGLKIWYPGTLESCGLSVISSQSKYDSWFYPMFRHTHHIKLVISCSISHCIPIILPKNHLLIKKSRYTPNIAGEHDPFPFSILFPFSPYVDDWNPILNIIKCLSCGKPNSSNRPPPITINAWAIKPSPNGSKWCW